MKRFRRILVMMGGKDGGAAALEHAAAVAKEHSAKIMILDFVPPLPESLAISSSLMEATHRNAVDAKLASLGSLANELRQSGLSVAYELIEGVPEKALQRVVEHGHDLLIKSAEEPVSLAQRIFGTTGLRLMRKCPCPVWIVKAGGPKRFKRILAAVEPMPPDQQRDPLNIRIIELATSLARSNGSELHVLYVWPHWTDVNVPDPSQVEPEGREKLKREIDSLQRRMLDALLNPFREQGHTFQTHLLKGKPSDMIASHCRKWEVELMIMGTIRRPNLLGFAIGSTAEQVLDQVRCSVLTLKPDDFDSLTTDDEPPA